MDSQAQPLQSDKDAIAVVSGSSSHNNGGENEPLTSVNDGASGSKSLTVQIREPPATGRYEVVKVVEKHGVFHSAIPVMPLPFAVLFCICNLFIPGSGEYPPNPPPLPKIPSIFTYH